MASFYINFSDNSKEVIVSGEEHHHIINVFRHKKGDVLPILNGLGSFAKGMITEIDKKQLKLELSDIIHNEKPVKRVACAFSLLKNKNDLLIVEKLTELGVADIFPIVTKNSVKIGKENTVEKYIKTAISAIKQCDNPYLPIIHNICDLETLLKKLNDNFYTPIVASEMRPNFTLTNYIKNNSNDKICIIIGPEGGWDNFEFKLFEAKQIQQVRLVGNILRAETAAICAVSLLIT